ncbi:MAG TPA: flagellar motor protein MotB [candidate division Zixibacteria bacterium]|nr:flagellar motor protein MotB [candidate division Zixibacteria bacterium]
MTSRSGKKQPEHGAPERTKVIVKKTGGRHRGHHGGAWKVAYADFVTAMMALFIVLWVLGASDKRFKAGIAHYFREPGVFSGSSGLVPDGGQDRIGAGIIQSPSLEVLRAQLREEIRKLKELAGFEDQISIAITEEGLLIDIIDKEKRSFFQISSATVGPTMRKVLEVIARQIREIPNKIVISGHTDARPYHDDSYYSNWELSSARALNTRRALEELGVQSDRIQRVVGHADRLLRVPDDPLSSENRRISILVLKMAKNGTR